MENEHSITYTSFLKIANRYANNCLHDQKYQKPKWEGVQYVEGNGEKETKEWMTKAYAKMRMYGSPEELAANLKIYRNFPGSDFYFNTDFCEPYNTTITAYYDSDNTAYLYKRDAFKVFQPVNRRPITIDDLTMSLPQAMGNLYLRCRENQFPTCIEFIPYDESEMTEILQEFIQMTSKPTKSQESEWDEITLPEMPIELESLCREFRKLIPEHLPFDHRSFETIREMLKYHLKSGPALEEWFYHFIYRCSFIIIHSMSTIIDSRPHIFSPSAKLDEKLLLNTRQVACFTNVRLFVDGTDKFLITRETFLGERNLYRHSKSRILGSTLVHTMSFQDFRELMKQSGIVDNFTYIEVPIIRTKHQAVPILNSSGSHCILAADFFFALMRDIFFTSQLFQKVEMAEWIFIHDYFLMLFDWFPPDVNFKYFVGPESVEAVLHQTFKQFMKFEPAAAVEVRNAKKDVGFNVDNLKNELAHMGLLKVFPEIQKYAEAAYERVVKEKKEEVLRTCDLFDAIEHCQLVAIVQRFPELVRFLHNQNACSRLVYTPCSQCLPKHSRPLLQYEYTVWRDYEIMMSRLSKGALGNRRAETFTRTLVLRDGGRLMYNVLLMEKAGSGKWMKNSEQSRVRIVFLDLADSAIAGARLGDAHQSRSISLAVKVWQNQMSNLEGILKLNKDKKIYLRTFSTNKMKKTQHQRVFVDEVLEVLPVLLEMQKTPPKPDIIQKYAKKWATGFGYLTIPLAELKMVLELFCINKCNLTLAPDISYIASREEAVSDDAKNPVFSILAPDNQRAMDVSQAVLHIFQAVVCEVNWPCEVCKKHKDCKIKFKTEILNAMREYVELREGTFIPLKHVENTIERLKSHCNFTARKNQSTPSLKVYSFKNSHQLSILLFMDMCNTPVPPDCTRAELENVTAAVWRLRFLIITQLMDMFFGDSDDVLKGLMYQALTFRLSHVDCENENGTLLDNVLSVEHEKRQVGKNEEKEGDEEDEDDEDDEDDDEDDDDEEGTSEKYKNLEQRAKEWNERVKAAERSVPILKSLFLDRKPKDSGNQDGTSHETATVEAQRPTPQEHQNPAKADKPTVSKPTSSEVVPNNAPPEKKQNESANCKKCYRTQQRCEEAKSQVKTLENEKKKLEGKLKTNNEKETKRMEQEWKAKFVEKERKHQEEINIITAQKTKMGEELTQARNNELQLMETISKLESALKQQEEHNSTKLCDMMKSMELRDSTIKQLKETVSAYSRSKFGESAERSEAMRKALFELKEIKDTVLRENPVHQVEQKTRRLISLSDDPNLKSGANVTLLTFRAQYDEYMKAVDRNILMIQNNPNLTSAQLDALPAFPTLSDGFLITYERVVKQELSKNVYWPEELNQMQEPLEKELADKECIFCLLNMTSKTDTVKCPHCYRRFHDKCVKRWVLEKKTCPTCYANFPKELVR